MVRGCGLGGTLRMGWIITDPKAVYYEGQWLKIIDPFSYGAAIHRMYWIPRELRGYLDYILGGRN